jgi:hypothetical protein
MSITERPDTPNAPMSSDATIRTIVSEETARRARADGVEVVMDECIGGTTDRLRAMFRVRFKGSGFEVQCNVLRCGMV